MQRILLAAIVVVSAAAVSAQTPQGQGGDPRKDMTNCTTEQGETTGAASKDAKAVEKSAILPSAEGHPESAAPTVQRDGKAAEARADCPQDAGQPKPGG